MSFGRQIDSDCMLNPTQTSSSGRSEILSNKDAVDGSDSIDVSIFSHERG
jgi:hypothetical protein